MNITRRIAIQTGLGTALCSLTLSALRAEDGPLFGIAEGAEDFWLATDAYIYGYPLVTVEMTRRVATNVAKLEGTRGPMGQLIKFREYPNASFKDVTAPNADTLYTSAPNGLVHSHGASKNTNPRPISFGFSAASTAPERRRTTPQFTRFRISSSWCH